MTPQIRNTIALLNAAANGLSAQKHQVALCHLADAISAIAAAEEKRERPVIVRPFEHAVLREEANSLHRPRAPHLRAV